MNQLEYRLVYLAIPSLTLFAKKTYEQPIEFPQLKHR